MRCLIARTVLDRLVADAADSPDAEICGLLFGTADVIDAAQPAQNVAADPGRRFELDPAVLFAAIRAERAGGPRLVGYYHSHPSGDPVPSACDAAEASEQGRLWLIMGRSGARLWLSRRGGAVHGAFDPMALAIA